MLGQTPQRTMQQTLPELKLAMRGWQRANGIDPDARKTGVPMTRARLMELAKRYESNEAC